MQTKSRKSLTILAMPGLAAVAVMLSSGGVVFAQSQDQDQLRYHRPSMSLSVSIVDDWIRPLRRKNTTVALAKLKA